MYYQTLQYEIEVKVPCTSIIDKSLLVGKHAFSLTEMVSWMAHSIIICMSSSYVGGIKSKVFSFKIFKCGAYPF